MVVPTNEDSADTPLAQILTTSTQYIHASFAHHPFLLEAPDCQEPSKALSSFSELLLWVQKPSKPKPSLIKGKVRRDPKAKRDELAEESRGRK